MNCYKSNKGVRWWQCSSKTKKQKHGQDHATKIQSLVISSWIPRDDTMLLLGPLLSLKEWPKGSEAIFLKAVTKMTCTRTIMLSVVNADTLVKCLFKLMSTKQAGFSNEQKKIILRTTSKSQ